MSEPVESRSDKHSRARLFIENMLVYGLGGMLSKLVPLLMLPIVTRLMPGTEYYGLSDLSNTLVSFCQAFAIMGMYDAMFRMFFEEASSGYKRRVCSTAYLFVTSSSILVAIVMLCLRNPIARVFFGGAEYTKLVIVSAVSVFIGGNNSIIQAPTRMQNKRVIFIVMNLVTSVLSYSVSIPLILAGRYLLALPVAATVASFTSLCVFYALNRNWFSPISFDMGLLQEMLAIGVPLMPSFIFYWVFHSADRLMILSILGAGSAGIYAVSAKLGQISQLIYTAFAQGWQFFAFSTMRDSDQVRLNSRIYEYLGVISFAATGMFMLAIKPLYGVLFPSRYAGGISSAPYLFLAPLLLMLYQVAVNQLLVIKKTWPSLFILSLGAGINVLLNRVLIPLIGLEGAALATLAGYLAANITALVLLTRMRLLDVGMRFYIVTAAFISFFIIWRFVTIGHIIMTAVAWSALVALAALLYRKDILMLTPYNRNQRDVNKSEG